MSLPSIKKVGIYSPYLETVGGGERYAFSFAECFASNGLPVNIFLDENLKSSNGNNLLSEFSSQFGIDTSNIKLIDAPFGKRDSAYKRHFFLKDYQIIFYLTDGSVFYNPSRNGFLHFQVPYTFPAPDGFLARIKINSWQHKICNSFFTKKFIDKFWEIETRVVYPPVDVKKFHIGEKENVILSVGRFFDFLHTKRQDVMIEIFKEMYLGGLSGWKLVMIGSSRKDDTGMVERLRKSAEGFPIEIIENPNFDKLKEWYACSKIYWHAAGFEVDQDKSPEKVEHFGISTVEAMAAGCVPVVINKGGQPEIVDNEENGYLWETREEIKMKTWQLMQSEDLRGKLSTRAIDKSKKFSKERFCKEIKEMVESD